MAVPLPPSLSWRWQGEMKAAGRLQLLASRAASSQAEVSEQSSQSRGGRVPLQALCALSAGSAHSSAASRL